MNILSKLTNLSLVRRFVLTGLLVLLAGMALIGTWVGTQIESGVINGTGVVTNLYLDSAISPRLQSLATDGELEDADRLGLDRLLTGSHLGEQDRPGWTGDRANEDFARAQQAELRVIADDAGRAPEPARRAGRPHQFVLVSGHGG